MGNVPIALAAKLMMEAFRTFASLRPQSVKQITVVLFTPGHSEAWLRASAPLWR